jgi:hypothetical protein
VFFKVFLSSKGSQNFGPQATLTCPEVHILCMAILGGCVPDFLPSKRQFELESSHSMPFFKAARIRVNLV